MEQSVSMVSPDPVCPVYVRGPNLCVTLVETAFSFVWAALGLALQALPGAAGGGRPPAQSRAAHRSGPPVAGPGSGPGTRSLRRVGSVAVKLGLCRSEVRGVFPGQGSKLCLPHCRRILCR